MRLSLYFTHALFKSEKPIHLGQTQEEEEEKEEEKKLRNYFSTACQHTSVIHMLHKHFIAPSLIVPAPHSRHVP